MPKGEHKGWRNRGYLPHFDSPCCVQHIVMRAIDSLPATTIASLPIDSTARNRALALALDGGQGTRPFAKQAAAKAVEDTLLHFDGARYDLVAWCVMPNHAHVAAQWRTGFRLGDTIKSWKTYSARRLNGMAGATGAVWAPDYFDRFVRDEADLVALVAYIENNPVSAGLVDAAEAFAFSSARRRCAD
ncbi:MAG: transposase [Methylobacteriaceae bacterium]|nr:transposase [Methylobacteriaceae bacterium]